MKWNLFKEKAPPGKRWLSCLAMALAITSSAATVFAAPVIAPDAEYSQPRLGPNPVGHAWGNVVPNALADYFTFVPYATGDATALGFPATCGATTDLLAVPPVIGEDCYTITVKAFPQPLSLAPILGATWGTNGLLGPTDTYFGPANYTNVYGYGSGGTGWTPPQFIWGAGNAIQKNLTPKTLTKGNAPTTFAGFQFDAKDKGIWHFPAPSIKGTKGRPIRIQWLNELPNTVVPGLDPTVDCSDSSPNCFPYNRIVTHVHGAHVGPASDGLTQGEYNPDFSNKGVKFGLTVLPPAEGPPGTYVYPMDQEAATIWYHDHAAGNTHLNTNMGMAGFFPITDDNEKCLQGISHPTLCPTPTKVLPTGTAASGFTDSAYELGFALQDRVFYTNGQLAMPDAPVIDGNFPSCDQTSAASRLATCSPLFMYVKHAANADSNTPAGVHMVPYDEFTMDTTIPENANAPVLATSATLEFFGNMPVVNGVVYGKYDIEPRVYRMRFLGGTDSRTWDLQLEAYDATGLSLGFIPFWQIGTEQGFLNNPISRGDILLMPGERVDVLIDFAAAKALYPTMTKVMLNNLGTDAPFQGEQLTPFNRSVDIPEIMQFNLITLGATLDVPAPSALLNLRPTTPITPMTATPGVPVRRIALEEIVDEYQRIMPTIDRRGYDLPGMQATEIVRLNDTEIWDLINTTADAHPMHLHQVAFQVVHRQPFTSFTPAINDIASGVFSQANYTVDNIAGPPVPPDPHDAGFKDTVYTPPGFVTRVIARFDLVGEYVWHCHILSHEEHDMMRPLKIVASALNPPASLTVPATAPDNRTITVTVAPASPANPVAVKYYVEYKKPADANWTTNSLGSGTSQTFTLPSDGTYDLRVKSVDAAISPTYSDSTYTLGSTQIVAAPADQITSPVNNSVLGSTSQTFTFSTSGPYSHYLWVGTTGAGSSDLGRYTAAAGVNSITVNGLPLNATINVRLWVKVTAGAIPEMRFRDYTYTISPYAVTLTPSVASPQPTGTTVTFTATGAGGTGPYEYRFWINSGAGYVIVQNYSALNTYAWTPVTAGAYDIMVDMRVAGTTVVRNASAKIFFYRITSTTPATGVALTSNLASPQPVNTPITFTALGQGGSGAYEYRFWINSGAGYTIVRNYSVTNTFTWTPATAGAYDIMVDVRNAGSTVVRDASAKIFFYRITAPAASGVTLTSSLASPQPVNTPITFTALGQGGSGTYEYRFWINSGAGYTIVRNYSTTNTFTWTPTATGAYDILVDVRNVGSTALREASNKILFYRIQ